MIDVRCSFTNTTQKLQILIDDITSLPFFSVRLPAKPAAAVKKIKSDHSKAGAGPVTDDNSALQSFCECLERTLRHGMKGEAFVLPTLFESSQVNALLLGMASCLPSEQNAQR